MRRVFTIVIVAQVAFGCHGAAQDPHPLPKVEWKIPASGLPREGDLARSRRPLEHLARRPHFKRPVQGGVRCNADGSLGEWQSLRWFEKPVRLRADSNTEDLSARMAVASYSGGLSLALVARDDSHVPAKALGMFGRTDAVEIVLTPAVVPKGMDASLLGVRFWLGTFRTLVRFDKPSQRWRDAAVASFGAETPQGWQLEARIPLSTLTPLPAPRVARWRYRVTLHDADGNEKSAHPSLRFEGEIRFDSVPEVHEAVRRRLSIRACMAAFPQRALWGFHNGWRCSVPYERRRFLSDDAAPGPLESVALSHARMPTPPVLRYLRERVVLLNFPGLGRGLAALVKGDKTLISLLDVGIVGARSPGNGQTKESNAKSWRLPDGTWAFSVVHAFPEQPALARPLGGRCEDGRRVFLSIIAVRGAPHVTPHKVVPEPNPPPELEEVLRVQIAGCEDRVARRWRMSADAREVRIYDSLRPSSSPGLYVYDRGIYRRQRGGGD
ncbi:MAG: hypothetical protein JRH20_02060 [Deltaproteobacteria bacterium]|nr:hypothetical protein [Deltaproteobacteria bacterium]